MYSDETFLTMAFKCVIFIVYLTGTSVLTRLRRTGGLKAQIDKMTKNLELARVPLSFYKLRRNPPDVGVTSGQKPCTKIIYVVLQTSVGLF